MEENDSVLNIKYCIRHGETVFVLGGWNGNKRFWHFDRTGVSPCYGPFTEVPPPPVLTEEDWLHIFTQEGELA